MRGSIQQLVPQGEMDSRLRGNDGAKAAPAIRQRLLDFCPITEIRENTKIIRRLPRTAAGFVSIVPGPCSALTLARGPFIDAAVQVAQVQPHLLQRKAGREQPLQSLAGQFAQPARPPQGFDFSRIPGNRPVQRLA